MTLIGDSWGQPVRVLNGYRVIVHREQALLLLKRPVGAKLARDEPRTHGDHPRACTAMVHCRCSQTHTDVTVLLHFLTKLQKNLPFVGA